MEQIIGSAGFGSAARHLESAEGMAADDGASAGAIDVNIACDQLRLDALDVRGTAGEESSGQCIVGVVRDPDGFIKVAHSDDA